MINAINFVQINNDNHNELQTKKMETASSFIQTTQNGEIVEVPQSAVLDLVANHLALSKNFFGTAALFTLLASIITEYFYPVSGLRTLMRAKRLRKLLKL